MSALIVDGSNLVMRAITASRGSGANLSAVVDGSEIDTSGLLLSINLLSKYIRQTRPDKVAVCFDSGSSDYRMKVDPNYKQSRATKDASVMDTFDLFREFLTVSEIHHLAIPGVEADDIVAAYVYKESIQSASRVIILSGDKDFLQLLSGNGNAGSVTQIRPGLNPELWTAQTVLDKMGVIPRNLAKMMALIGDEADDIPRIPRIGPKTAIKILTEYQWNLASATQHKLLVGKEDQIQRNYELVNLRNGPWQDFYKDLELQEFNPSHGEGVLAWLDRFHIASVRGRIMSGTLWKQNTFFQPNLISE